jgi:predicted ATP-binding protein involved in virulence
MKIRKLQLKNIGVFDDEPIEFNECEFNKGKEIKDRKAEIHILTGENGSGKTTVLLTLAEIVSYARKDVGVGEVLHVGIVNLEFSKRQRSDSYYGFSFEGNETESIDEINKYFNNYRNGKTEDFSFAFFAYSGYRRIKDEPIEIGKENDEHPLKEALDFVKDENSKFNVNQWLGQNLLNSSLAQTKNKLDEAKVFDEKIKRFEKVINDIIADETNDNEIRFEMQSATKLVLIKNEQELDFDVLPDGLKSLISWIGDLLMRLDSLKWKDDTPIFDREIILFLDEIEVHLHPAWQRKVLPIVQKLFKNAQIFVSTHSPFVVNSVDDAWVYKLKVTDGKAKVEKPYKKTENSQSITQVLREVFDIYGLFGDDVQNNLDKLGELRDKILSNGTDLEAESEFLRIAKLLAKEPSDQIKNIVRGELEQLSDIKGKKFLI